MREKVLAKLLDMRERALASSFAVLGDFHADEDAYQETE